MTVRFQERPNSGDSGASPPTLTKEYFLSGVEDDYIALAYSLSATETSVATPAGILWRQDVQMHHEGFEL